MNAPSFADNIFSLKKLFELYQKTAGSKKNGHPFIFEHIDIIIFLFL